MRPCNAMYTIYYTFLGNSVVNFLRHHPIRHTINYFAKIPDQLKGVWVSFKFRLPFKPPKLSLGPLGNYTSVCKFCMQFF